jgi:hypothetical protein
MTNCDKMERGYFDILWTLIHTESPDQKEEWNEWSKYVEQNIEMVEEAGESPEYLEKLKSILAKADKGYREDAAYHLEELLTSSSLSCRCKSQPDGVAKEWYTEKHPRRGEG